MTQIALTLFLSPHEHLSFFKEQVHIISDFISRSRASGHMFCPHHKDFFIGHAHAGGDRSPVQ